MPPMKSSLFVSLVFFLSGLLRAAEPATQILNPLIDYTAYRQEVQRVEPIRASHRLSEADFLRAAGGADTVLLDARSGPMFRRLHVAGAVNLSFPDFNVASLAAIIPDKNTRILIYCNNNFLGSPIAMTSKAVSASLNVSTFVALHSYGYTNVYELGPLLDVKTTALPLAGTETERKLSKITP